MLRWVSWLLNAIDFKSESSHFFELLTASFLRVRHLLVNSANALALMSFHPQRRVVSLGSDERCFKPSLVTLVLADLGVAVTDVEVS